MIAWAFGPGSGVRMSGAFMMVLPSLPPGSRSRVFQHDPPVLEVLADLVRAREVAVASRVAAFLDQPFDLLDRHRRLRVLVAPEGEHAENLIELLDRVVDSRRAGGA